RIDLPAFEDLAEAVDAGDVVTARESKAVPDVEVAAGVLQLRIVAVLRQRSKTIQRTSVEAMAVRITSEERNPVGKPLGQSRLKTVVVGIGAVRSLVDKVQVRKLCGVRTDARREIDLIDVTKEKQSFADIRDIANLQRDIVGEGVL